MLRQKILVFEHLLGIFFLLQIIFPTFFTRNITLICFTSLLTAKYFLEGIRITIFLIIIIQTLLLFTSSIYIRLPLAFLMHLAIKYFPVYKYPEPLGKYKVGYKRIIIPNVTSIGVYYPTTQQTEDVHYAPDHTAWRRMAIFVRFIAELFGKPQIPVFLFKIALHFLEHQHLGVNRNAKIAKQGTSKFPSVVFSHGLSANIHIYSLHMKEWASHGFIAFSVDHDEQIRLDATKIKKYEDYVHLRSFHLEDRRNTIKKALDFICNPANIEEFFEDSQVVLDYDNIFMSGHSLGGGTAAEIGLEDFRITGGLVLLDPWLDSCDVKSINNPINKPVLSIRSGEYEKMESTRACSVKHSKANSKDGLGLAGYFEELSHNSFSDLPLLMPRELVLFGLMKGMKKLEEQAKYQTVLSRSFLEMAILHNRNPKGGKSLNVKTLTLKRFRDNLKELDIKDLFLIDE